MDYAKQGEAGNLWIVSKKQTSGRGSRGRNWSSLEGNLLTSLLLHEPGKQEHFAELTFVAAVALYKSLNKICGSNHNLKLKWPNDILLNGKKCCGILLESKMLKAGNYVVIGIGVNCQDFPSQTLHEATSLKTEGIDVTGEDAFQFIAQDVATMIDFWCRGEGFQAVRNLWLENAYGLGEEVTIRIPGQDDKCGIFTSIDEAGYMLLETSDKKIQRISTADIFFNRSIT